MKNILTIIIVFAMSLLYTNSLNAQEAKKKEKEKIPEVVAENYVPQTEFRALRLGILGNMGLSWMVPKTEGYSKGGSRFAYSYGLLVDYNFTKNYTFSSGIGFNSLGGKLSYKTDTTRTPMEEGDMTRTYRINYLEIPTMLKLKTNQMGYLTYFTQLGLRHNFRLSSFSDDEFTPTGKATENTENVDMIDHTGFYRLSLNIGIGAEYAISQTFSAFGYIEYDNGLTNSLTGEKTKDDEIISPSESAFIKKFTITLGFLF